MCFRRYTYSKTGRVQLKRNLNMTWSLGVLRGFIGRITNFAVLGSLYSYSLGLPQQTST